MPTATARLDQQPQERPEKLALAAARSRSGQVAGTLELVLTTHPCFLAYRVLDEQVQSLRVLHTARQYPPSSRDCDG